ncbi:SAM-dependent methyltransferase [Thiohalomonas denitrificans]|uniref:SAM-dependent methyltransferase n=1 Tax=Thiohalomonas denitrificans TaxID=415747 RepID=UPI0026F25159|nr:SAM-dependent methyltransferase [Thiohalomonas denitrificans]
MAFELKQIVPWGRSFQEYVDMFALSEDDLTKPILGCGDGPAGFNAELTRRGGTVVSVDPIYAFGAEEIRRRIDETFDEVMRQTRQNEHEFVWDHIRSVGELGKMRMAVMRDFLEDFPQGRSDGRYLPQSAPTLDFPDDSFSLALSSHLLFLYSGHLDLKFHIEAIAELCRVSEEVRIFPLLQLGATPSLHVEPVTEHFRAASYEVKRVHVPYEFQRGGNQMLKIRKVEQGLTADTLDGAAEG